LPRSSSGGVYCYVCPARREKRIQITVKRASGNPVQPDPLKSGKGSLNHRVGTGVVGYCLPVLLPIVSAVTTAVAAVNHGPVRVYWIMGSVGAIGAGSVLSVMKERRTKSAYKNAERTKAELATKLADIGFPLLIALGNVTSASTVNDVTAAIEVLIDRSVGLAQTQLGKQTDLDCRIRATYYELDQNREKLLRNKSHYCAGQKLPRPDFVKGRNDHDDEAIKLALREDVLFIPNLDNESLPGSTDSTSRSYKTLIAVPVRAGKSSYGLLTADSNLAYSLTNADRGFLMLVAGTLAAGLAHMEAVKSPAKS
jgi:hypothetical protein